MKAKVLRKQEPITCRPADLLEPGLDQARKDADGLARSEEDVLTFALFPEIAKEFFQAREARVS
jgi:pyruvate/oxaloacetate carboxyltransferase